MDLDIMKKVLDYNERDCLVLQEGFFNFRHLIFKNFNVDIINSHTIASLSQKIYLTNFYKYETLYVLDENCDKYIRESYFGGKTEVFKPYGEHIYSYDCNSLYSYVMKTFSYPIGIPVYVDGSEITKKVKNKKGFFHVRVSAPADLKYPFLVCRDPRKAFSSGELSGLISPLGEWNAVYFSEEINYAKGLGYTFEYIDGYVYDDEGYIFKDFVDNLYDMRLEYKKNTGLNKTCKLLLNALYGKFGMRPNKLKTEIVFKASSRYHEIIAMYEVINDRNINDLRIVSYFENDDYLDKYDKYANVRKQANGYSQKRSNVAIASAVSSYARIYMDIVMRKIGFKNVYYSDTDSIFSSVPMEENMISDNSLGKFKLEGMLKEAIFIAPKMYSYKNETTNKEKVVFKGFSSKSFTHEDFKKHYFENTLLSSEELNSFIRDFRSLQIRSTIRTKKHGDKFKKRTKLFDEKNQWVDTTPLIIKDYGI